MASSTTAERRQKAEAAAMRADLLCQEHRAKAARYAASGKADKAAEFEALALRQEGLASGHRREGERLAERERRDLYKAETGTKTREALNARSAALAAERPAIDPLQVYMQALEEAERVRADAMQLRSRASRLRREGETGKADLIEGRAAQEDQWAAEWMEQADRAIASTGGRDLPAERAAELARRARAAGQQAKEEGRRADLKLETNGATAAGQREYVAGGLRKERIAILGEYLTLIPRAEDRLPSRIEAMERLDSLFAGAEAGLFPSPKFEQGTAPGSGAGRLVAIGHAHALDTLDRLRRAIGGPNVEMLRARIYERQTLIALARAGYGNDKTAGPLVLAAIDAAARWLKSRDAMAAMAEPERVARVVERRTRHAPSP